MDALNVGSMADHNHSSPTRRRERPLSDTSALRTQTMSDLVNTDDALLNTQVVRRRSRLPRKRLSLNLSNLPAPVVNLSGNPNPRRAHRLSLPQQLLDLEIDVNPSAVEPRCTVAPVAAPSRPITATLSSPCARCPRTRIPVVVPSSQSPERSRRAAPQNRLNGTRGTEGRGQTLQVSLETALAAVTLRSKSPQTAADRRSNADFRLSFEMDI